MVYIHPNIKFILFSVVDVVNVFGDNLVALSDGEGQFKRGGLYVYWRLSKKSNYLYVSKSF